MLSVSLMWGVWGASFLVFIAFRVYLYRMSRNEEDQLVLQESSARLVAEQRAIATRLENAKPVGTAILAVFGCMTIFVFGYYIVDMIHQFR